MTLGRWSFISIIIMRSEIVVAQSQETLRSGFLQERNGGEIF